MGLPNRRKVLTIGVIFFAMIVFGIFILKSLATASEKTSSSTGLIEFPVKNTASNDSASESLKTLTAVISTTKQHLSELSKTNDSLKKQNDILMMEVKNKHTTETDNLQHEMEQLKDQFKSALQNKTTESKFNPETDNQSITTVPDLIQENNSKKHDLLNLLNTNTGNTFLAESAKQDAKPKVIPFYTIPANATSVRDKLMTALVGRIPVKGIVTDPYPFKIVIANDNLAANGLRIPNLLQMIVSGYCEGDLNLVSVRGWVTSLTFVFQDGSISTTTSNDNDIGNFTKANSLGFLSDQYGNPFIRGKLITNAPAYLSGGVALGAAAAGANAYAQAQTTNSSSPLGSNTQSVTGSQSKYMVGQMASGATGAVQQWWHDREEQSFDAVYVPTIDDKGQSIQIVVNFAKEIHIDYDLTGRKLNYAHDFDNRINQLD